jgi:hypothetical protein
VKLAGADDDDVAVRVTEAAGAGSSAALMQALQPVMLVP